jgi:hypothetical protein
MVSTFATGQHLVLGQVKVAKKSNEIIAIPKLLNMFAIKGAIVTIDAIGCQRDIAQKILDNKANYVLALKGQPGIVARGRRAVRRGARGPKASRTQKSVRTRRSMPITAASKPEPPPHPRCRMAAKAP